MSTCSICHARPAIVTLLSLALVLLSIYSILSKRKWEREADSRKPTLASYLASLAFSAGKGTRPKKEGSDAENGLKSNQNSPMHTQTDNGTAK